MQIRQDFSETTVDFGLENKDKKKIILRISINWS